MAPKVTTWSSARDDRLRHLYATEPDMRIILSSLNQIPGLAHITGVVAIYRRVAMLGLHRPPEMRAMQVRRAQAASNSGRKTQAANETARQMRAAKIAATVDCVGDADDPGVRKYLKAKRLLAAGAAPSVVADEVRLPLWRVFGIQGELRKP